MPERGPGRKLTGVVGEGDTWRHEPLSTEIVRRAHAAGLGGAGIVYRHKGRRA